MAQRILLVEDEEFIRDLYKRQLDLAGFETVISKSADEALPLVTQNAYDLVLLDIMLPGTLGGIDLLRKMKQDEKTKSMKVVVLTNLGQDEVIKEAFQLGAEGFLIKSSLTPDQVVLEVKNYLANIPQAPPNPPAQ